MIMIEVSKMGVARLFLRWTWGN